MKLGLECRIAWTCRPVVMFAGSILGDGLLRK